MAKAVCIILILFMAAMPLHSLDQDTTGLGQVLSGPDRLFSSLGKRASLVEGKLEKQTQKYLARLQKQEGRLWDFMSYNQVPKAQPIMFTVFTVG